MTKPKFSVSTKQYLGEDLCIVETASENAEIPVAFLSLKDKNFPLSPALVASNIINLLHDKDPAPIKTNEARIYFERQPGGFDLRYQKPGMNVSEAGLSVRVHSGRVPQELQKHVAEKLIPGDDTEFASSLCASVEVIASAKNFSRQPRL